MAASPETNYSLLTRREAAELARVSLRTFDSWLRAKIIPHIRVGGRVLIRKAALEATLAKLEIPAIS